MWRRWSRTKPYTMNRQNAAPIPQPHAGWPRARNTATKTTRMRANRSATSRTATARWVTRGRGGWDRDACDERASAGRAGGAVARDRARDGAGGDEPGRRRALGTVSGLHMWACRVAVTGVPADTQARDAQPRSVGKMRSAVSPARSHSPLKELIHGLCAAIPSRDGRNAELPRIPLP